MDWKKLKYLLILLCLFAEYTALIGNTRDATINHTWNVYNTLFDHMDMIRHKFNYKDVEKTLWMSEFIMAVNASTEKLKEYYSKTGGSVESQYPLAAMLDSSQKLGIFESPKWGRPWIRKYTKKFVEHWSANYCRAVFGPGRSAEPEPELSRSWAGETQGLRIAERIGGLDSHIRDQPQKHRQKESSALTHTHTHSSIHHCYIQIYIP